MMVTILMGDIGDNDIGDNDSDNNVYNGARDAVWRCCDCDFTLPALQIASQEKDVTMDLGSIARDDVRGLEDFLARHKQLLHHNHAAMMEVENTFKCFHILNSMLPNGSSVMHDHCGSDKHPNFKSAYCI